MTQEEIIEMAREADLDVYDPPIDLLQRFAKLVAQKEREACAYRAGIALLGADRGLSNRVNQAIKAALEAKDEPVAWRAWVSKFPQGTGSDWVYVTKPIMKDSVHNQPLYTTPPQRTWVGLTDEEVEDFVSALWPVGAGAGKLLRAVEAKLKEKNHA